MYILEIISVVLALIAISKANSAEKRVEYLANKLDIAAKALGLKPDGDINKIEQVPVFVQDYSKQIPPMGNSVKDNVKNEPYKENEFSLWLKENWIMKLGVSLILIGFVWALNYAYQNKVLGNGGVSTLGMLFGSILMTYGFVRMKNFTNQGSIFMLLGTGLIMLTSYFMKEKSIITEPIILMLIMLVSTAVTTTASVIYNKKGLAIASLLVAVLVPLFFSMNSNYLELYSYLLIVIIGTLWVVALKGWNELTLMSLIAVCLYSVEGVLSGFGKYENTALVFAFIFGIVFFVANTTSIIMSANKDKNTDVTFDTITAALNASMLSTFILTIIPSEWHSILLTLLALVFSIASFFIYKITKQTAPFFVYSGIALAMLAYVTFLICGNNLQALAAAYTIEIGALSLAAYLITKKLKLATELSLLFIVPLAILLPSIGRIMSSTDKGDLLIDYTVTSLFVSVSSALASYYLSQGKEEGKDGSDFKYLSGLILSTSGLIILSIIWGLCDLMFGEAGYSIALIIYAIIGTIMYVFGKNTNNNFMKIAGSVLIALTVFWLVTVLIVLEPIFRIIGFIVVGVVLLSSAFLLKNKN